MTRFILISLGVLVAAWILLAVGILPAPIAVVLEHVLGVISSFAIPILFLTAFYAPGLIQGVWADVSHFWRRVRTRKHDIEELERKIVHLDRPYHMNQLGVMYLQQGRIAKAQPWFERRSRKMARRSTRNITWRAATSHKSDTTKVPSCWKRCTRLSPTTITAWPTCGWPNRSNSEEMIRGRAKCSRPCCAFTLAIRKARTITGCCWRAITHRRRRGN